MAVQPADLPEMLSDRQHDLGAMHGVYEEAKAWWRRSKERIALLDRVQNGDWPVMWPDGSSKTMKPKIGDSITADLEEIGKLVGGPEPTVLVEADDESEESSVKAAALRHAAIEAYRDRSNLGRLRPRLAMDLAGSGLATVVTLPDYQTKDPAHRLPLYFRQNPRYVFPNPGWDGIGECPDAMVGFRTKATAIEQKFPGALMKLGIDVKDAAKTEVELIDFYGPDVTLKVVVLTEASGFLRRQKARVVPLVDQPNPTGRSFAHLAMRASFDGQPRGQFDGAIAPLLLANQMVTMHMESLADMIFSEKIVRGVFENPGDIGPGATLFTRDPNATIERVAPAGSNPQMYADIQLLQNEARVGSSVSAARRGDISQNIASAQFVTAIQGRDATNVEDYQKTMADLETRANVRALAIDEKMLGTENGKPISKPVSGMSEGKRFATTYRPVDFAGRYDHKVVYGPGSQVDKLQQESRVIMRFREGLISLREALAQIAEGGDPVAVERDIFRDEVVRGVLEGLKGPVGPDSAPLEARVKALEMVEEGKTPLEIAKAIREVLEAQAQEAAPLLPTDALAEQEGLTPVPGRAVGGLPPGRSAARPSLSVLREALRGP